MALDRVRDARAHTSEAAKYRFCTYQVMPVKLSQAKTGSVYTDDINMAGGDRLKAIADNRASRLLWNTASVNLVVLLVNPRPFLLYFFF